MQLLTYAHRLPVRLAAAAVAATIAAGAAAGPALASPSTDNAGFMFASSTIVSITGSGTVPGRNGAVLPGGTASVTATIRPGFLVGQSGTVTFIDGTNAVTLGTSPVGTGCFLELHPCTVTIQVSAASLTGGANSITADYSGDFFLRPSSGSAQLQLETQTSSGGVTTTDCGYACDTGPVTSSDGTTTADISGAALPYATVTESFTTTEDPCSTPGGGDVLLFSATGFTSNKTIVLTATGPTADTLLNDYFGGEHVCYESPAPFTTQSGAPAQLDPVSELYYGVLPQCGGGGGGESTDDGVGYDGTAPNPPCEDYSDFNAGGDGYPDTYLQQIEVKAADPHVSN